MDAAVSTKRLVRRACLGRRPGFTLVELLVVIGIISLLSSILLPSLIRARLLARRVACVLNLKALGNAAAAYAAGQFDYVPICWRNLKPSYPHPWKSWRTRLLAYEESFEAFNCPAGEDSGELGEVFHSAEDIRGYQQVGTTNAGSYGVIEQYSLPTFKAEDYSGQIRQGHPVWSDAFPITPGVAWRDPPNSVYVADSCMCKGPVTYPTESRPGRGSSVVRPPSDPTYDYFAKDVVSRRFADRHVGTNCLFLGGHVLTYETKRLDDMVDGRPDCIWDVE